ncbi:hypothetical protein CYMTET_23498 [Cymbomonas tetramitiformis]|uniref:Uncharacterized protein n=1 Tax=Cymbomonas tetramitiformis TaxID=36881 RepID=A0AAE0FYI8_9CHLO|nr:hypothetical protein CYMTET_23498 [Cymbomonas tetramitiformis]
MATTFELPKITLVRGPINKVEEALNSTEDALNNALNVLPFAQAPPLLDLTKVFPSEEYLRDGFMSHRDGQGHLGERKAGGAHTSRELSSSQRSQRSQRSRRNKAAGRYRLPCEAQPGTLASSSQRRVKISESAVSSTATQAAPLPWSRYFFPDHRQPPGPGVNVFYQYIDVQLPPPLDHDEMSQSYILEQAPDWLKDQWMQLYYVENLDGKTAAGSWPSVTMYNSKCLLDPDLDYWTDSEEALFMDLPHFVDFVARLKPRSVKDHKPLTELRAGLLQWLATQLKSAYTDAAKLYHAKEARLKTDFQNQVQAAHEAMERTVKEAISAHEMQEKESKRLLECVHRFKRVTRAVLDQKKNYLLNTSLMKVQELEDSLGLVKAKIANDSNNYEHECKKNAAMQEVCPIFWQSPWQHRDGILATWMAPLVLCHLKCTGHSGFSQKRFIGPLIPRAKGTPPVDPIYLEPVLDPIIREAYHGWPAVFQVGFPLGRIG